MKVSMPLMKLLIRLIILMILFVMIFLISTVLYSARYWPDVYNYINANITIKRIPTLSELNLTIIEVDYVTEVYTTTDIDYIDVSTIDEFDIDEFTLEEVEIRYERKRSILIEKPKDYIELPSRPIFVDYIFLDEPNTTPMVITDNVAIKTETSNDKDLKRDQSFEENLTNDCNKMIDASNDASIDDTSTTKDGYLIGDTVSSILLDESTRTVELLELTTVVYELDEGTRMIKDSVDESKLMTRDWKDVEMISRKPEKMTMEMADPICIGDATCQDFTKSVYPWLATIFIKNDTHNNQFSYYCDGALLSERVIITDARCLYVSNKTLDPNNVLVFLGKGSLQSTGGNEKVVRIKEIIVHENFTAEGEVANDLALLVTEEPVEYTEAIQNACVREGDDDTGDTATTAWGVNGDLIPIFFNKEKSETCSNKDDNIFCATYGNNVPFCPSYGGVYAAKGAERWCLQGIFYGDPVERGICFTKDVFYTSLKNYTSWIDDVIELNKNDL